MHQFTNLPQNLFRLLVHARTFFVGSRIKGDFTRLSKQFPTLSAHQATFGLIDLKDLARDRQLIQWDEHGSLADLVRKILGAHLPKDSATRINNEWELPQIRPHLISYASLDVYASQRLYSQFRSTTLPRRIDNQTMPGTKVIFHVNEGAPPAALCEVVNPTTSAVNGVRVKNNPQTRVVVTVKSILLPTATSILHFEGKNPSKARAGDVGLSLRSMESKFRDMVTGEFQMVVHMKQLTFQPNDVRLKYQIFRLLLTCL